MPTFESSLTQSFHDHWTGLRDGGRLPSAEAYFDRIDPRLAPLLIVFECGVDDIRIRFQGTKVVERWRADHTGQSWLETKPIPKRPMVLANMRDCADLPCGVWAKSAAVSRSGRAARQENLTLPLAVQSNRPHRLVLLSTLLESPADPNDAYIRTEKARIEWLDVGFGIPPHPLRRG